MTDLISAQIATERMSLDEGRLRFLKQQERIEQDKGKGSRDDVSRLIRNALPDVTQAIVSSLKSTPGYGNGKRDTASIMLSNLEPELLALIALSRCFSGSVGGSQSSVVNICASIGRGVEEELWGKALREEDMQLYVRLTTRATKTHGSVRYRTRAIRSTAAKEGFKIHPFSQEVRVKLGEPLLNAVLVACSSVFETYMQDMGKGQFKSLGLTKEASDALREITEAMSWMHPVFRPMLVPPKPWEAFDTGCYLTREMQMRTPLVRTYDKKAVRLIKEAIRSRQMQPCLDALNAIQATPWRINRRVYEIMVEAFDRGLTFEGFPQKHHIPRPERPANYDTRTPEEQKGWRIEAAQVALRNRGIDGDRITFVQDLAVSNSLVAQGRFYLPHSLDFRGRVYPVPHLSHQRADHIKACFEFADGLPLGDEGAYWLAIHLANVWDKETPKGKTSKLPFDERLQFVKDNAQLIYDVAASPWQHTDVWTKADKPFQFLAACFDYATFLEEGECAVSHLPIALDGSNSGLQHYSAALRSSEGKLVNLVPSDKPVDIYQLVADAVKHLLQQDASPVAKLVLDNGVDRKLVKRNTMTFAYSSEEYGFRQQQMVDKMRPLSLEVLQGKRETHPYAMPGKDGRPDGGFAAATKIAKTAWAAITHLVRDASVGMKFFQDCARALAHEGKGLTWVTPVGLPVTHRYTEWDTKVVKMYLYDKSVPVGEAGPGDRVVDGQVHKQVRVTVRTEPKRRIDKGKAKSAVAPNVIHSMDAAHLKLTVLAAVKEGISHFALVHDSFATHAARTADFFYIIRETFARMYSEYCPFTEIYSRTLEALDDPSNVPQTPEKGSLDVALVSQSLYAFA